MSGFPFKTALFAIVLSPFILNAELREDLDDDDYVTYTDDRDDENEDGLYYDDDLDDDLADASYSRQDSYSERDDGDTDKGCHSPFHRMHVGVRHTEARGVGYKDGYTTLEGFGIYDHNPNFMPFLDVRGHVFNNGKLAGNVGIGERTVLSSINHMIGAYLYYDVRQENHNFTINQLSPGLELLGKRMEYRMNGYFPVGGHRSHKYGYQFNRFSGNNILLRQKQKFAMKGGDAEVGAHLTQSTKYDLYAGAGPYYFSAGRSHGWGGKVRLLGRYKEYVSLEASYSYDRVFRNVVQGTVGLNYAFGKKLSRRDRNCPQKNDLMLSRAAFAPYRFEIPVVKKIRKNVKAINPATGKPWQVWFVDNTSSSAGTFQSPFPTLAQAQAASSPNDMIYVFPGDGTTKGMDAGIVLQDGQKLFGSSVTHRIKTIRGKMVIPAFSETAPTITNLVGSIVVEAPTGTDNIEISGMNIFVPALNAVGIVSRAPNIFIHRNTIFGIAGSNGIGVFNSTKAVVTQNQLITPTFPNIVNGILIALGDNKTADVTVSQNSITGYATSLNFQGSKTPDVPAGTFMISQNSFSNFGITGLNLAENLGNPWASTTMFIVQNTFNNTAGTNGITLLVNLPHSGSFSIQDNNIVTTSSKVTSGIFADLGTGSERLYIRNNAVVTGATAGSIGISARSISTGTLCTSITGNEVTLSAPTGTTGIRVATVGAGIVNIDDFSKDQAPSVSITGNVNLVPPGTCSQ